MSEATSSRAERREQRSRDIQDHACRLVVERGFDGFTMDDLALAAGVSRRTLFNYVPDKMTAVLGELAVFGGGELDRFVAPGHHGAALVPDLVAFVRAGLARVEAAHPGAAGRFLVVERAIAADPKVAHALKQQILGMLDELAGAVCRREGWVTGDLRARILVTRLGALAVVMLDEVVRRRGAGSFVDVFDELLAAEAEVLGCAPGGAGAGGGRRRPGPRLVLPATDAGRLTAEVP